MANKADLADQARTIIPGSDIVDQLRSRNFGKGALEERAADEISRLRKQAKMARKTVGRWLALKAVMPADEFEQLRLLADHQTALHTGKVSRD